MSKKKKKNIKIKARDLAELLMKHPDAVVDFSIHFPDDDTGNHRVFADPSFEFVYDEYQKEITLLCAAYSISFDTPFYSVEEDMKINRKKQKLDPCPTCKGSGYSCRFFIA